MLGNVRYILLGIYSPDETRERKKKVSMFVYVSPFCFFPQVILDRKNI